MKNCTGPALAVVEKSRKVFVGSVDDEGWPAVKVMFFPRRQEGLKIFYSSTNTSSLRVAQYRKNPKACLYFYDGRFYRGVMLRGLMEVLHDQELKNSLWQEGDMTYYPLGPTDPDYCVLRFTAISGRYYANFASTEFIIE